ncbi:MAG: patatin-like phospholipase family protein [Elusimicrobiota bacterium]|jgi:NTE family protein
MRRLSAGLLAIAFIWSAETASVGAARSPVASEDQFLLDALWDGLRTLPHHQKTKVGLALGGGGARGLAHIGVLKVLQEENIPINLIAGTSVGALIGALFASGISTTDMEEMCAEIGWSSLTNYSQLSLFKLLVMEELLSTRNMEVYLRKHIGDQRFDQLKIPFTCSATDLQTGERVVFREGSVAFAARASAAVPGLFEPVLFRHRYLVDGGLVSNIPTDLLTEMGADIIVAVDVTADFSRFQPRNILATLNQAIYIQSEAMSKAELARADVVVRPQMGDISAIDLTRSAESIDAGILSTRLAVPAIKRVILDKNFDLLIRSRAAAL